MKIAVFGLPGFPLGKKIVADERLDKLTEMAHPPKTTYISLEVVGEEGIKTADGIICLDAKRADLVLVDLELFESRLTRVGEGEERNFLLRCQQELEKETLINELNLNEAEQKIIAALSPVTARPVLFLSEEESHDAPTATSKTYKLAGMICFFTVGPKEARAWPIKNGTQAVEAAGVVHSDIQRGFIKAEVIAYEDIIKLGGLNPAKARAMHLEDKEYVVKDGDVMNFRFNV